MHKSFSVYSDFHYWTVMNSDGKLSGWGICFRVWREWS